MQFQTAEFLGFFFLTFVGYYTVFARKVQWIWLLVVSFVYYALWDIEYVPFLLLTIIVSYGLGLLIERIKKPQLRKGILVIGCTYCVIYLGLFKYLNFFSANMCEIMGKPQVEFNLIIPIGISFYTFQTIGYLVDIYRGEMAEKNIFKYALMVSFFPHIVSGPIGRIKNLKEELFTIHKYNHKNVVCGSVVFLIGMFMKLVIADKMAIFVNGVYENWVIQGGSMLFVASLFYTLQIYCDFAGYSYMALGISRVLGIEIINNFERPYFSKTIKEFWQRWHISLSTWLKDYLYIPLGGSRKGEIRANLNKLIVFTVSGLWHGANWTFVIWGLLHGIYQIIGAMTKRLRERLYELLKIPTEGYLKGCVSTISTFLLVNLAWIFFRADNVTMALGIITRILTDWDIWTLMDGTLYTVGLDAKELLFLAIAVMGLMIMELHGSIEQVAEKVFKSHLFVRWGFLYLLIIVILVWGVYGMGYNATNFIYAQF